MTKLDRLLLGAAVAVLVASLMTRFTHAQNACWSKEAPCTAADSTCCHK